MKENPLRRRNTPVENETERKSSLKTKEKMETD